MQDNNPAGRKPRMYGPRKCADCPVSFTPTGSRQTRCLGCQVTQDEVVASATAARSGHVASGRVFAPGRTCAFADCGGRLRSDNRTGFCVTHAKRSPLVLAARASYFAKLREQTGLRPDERPFCSVDDCQKRLRSDNSTGRCREHAYLPRDMPTCAVGGCEKKLIASNRIGRCIEHRALIWAADARSCAADGCDRTLSVDNKIGYCREHRFLSPTRQEYSRNYYQENQVELREYATIYRQEHTEEHRASSRAWAEANPERKARNSWRSAMLVKYGLTEERHAQMWADQRGLCALCEKPPKPVYVGGAAVLHVDHDHVTGRVRALLCKDCNNGLGNFFDEPDLLRRAADYIEHFARADSAA